MLQRTTIRFHLASLLLLVSLFSATPKIILHNLVVRHQDTPSHAIGSTDQVEAAGYHCDCDNQVVELPYLYAASYIPQSVQEAYPAYQTRTDHSFYSFRYFIFGFRGPPVHSFAI